MNGEVTVSGAARNLEGRLGVVVRPRDISDLFYKRLLPEDRCPILNGRRMIPLDYLPVIERALRERGLIPAREEVDM